MIIPLFSDLPQRVASIFYKLKTIVVGILFEEVLQKSFLLCYCGCVCVHVCRGKLKRAVGQFTPYSWTVYQWGYTESFKRFSFVCVVIVIVSVLLSSIGRGWRWDWDMSHLCVHCPQVRAQASLSFFFSFFPLQKKGGVLEERREAHRPLWHLNENPALLL